MLFSIDGKKIHSIPKSRKVSFNGWIKKLSESDYNGIYNGINSYFDEKEVVISSYIPGKDWTGTVYQPIYEACNQDQQNAAFFFGLIVWSVVIERNDTWYFKPSDQDFDDVMGMTYFQSMKR